MKKYKIIKSYDTFIPPAAKKLYLIQPLPAKYPVKDGPTDWQIVLTMLIIPITDVLSLSGTYEAKKAVRGAPSI